MKESKVNDNNGSAISFNRGSGKIEIVSRTGVEQSAHMKVRELIGTIITPLIEMQNRGEIKHLGVVMGGSIVENPRETKDIDMIVYFEMGKLGEYPDENSVEYIMCRYLLASNTKAGSGIGMSVPIIQEQDNTGMPEYFDVNFYSRRAIIGNIENEDGGSMTTTLVKMIEEINSRARYSLSLDWVLYDDDVRQKDIYTTLILCKSLLGKYPRDVVQEINKFVDVASENPFDKLDSNKPEEIDSFLLEYISTKINDSRLECVIRGEEIEEKERKQILYDFVQKKFNNNDRTLLNHAMSLINGHTYIGRFSQTGLLIYGENIIYKGKPLFREDPEFLKK